MSLVMWVFGPCFCCGRLFSYSASRVPSLPVHGVREPICQACVDRVNPDRIAKGLPPIVPLPGAYEPDDASDLELPEGD
jgi:hypothetical protein